MPFYLLPMGSVIETSRILRFDTIDHEVYTFETEATDHPVEDQGTGKTSVCDQMIARPTTISVAGFITNTPVKPWSADFVHRATEGIHYAEIPSLSPAGTSHATRNPLTGQVQVTQGARPVEGSRMVAASGQVWPVEFNAVKDAATLLYRWRKEKVLLSFVGSEFRYDRMIATNWSYTPEGTINPEARGSKPFKSGGATFTIELKQIDVVSTATTAAPEPKEPRGSGKKPKGDKPPAAVDDRASRLISEKTATSEGRAARLLKDKR